MQRLGDLKFGALDAEKVSLPALPSGAHRAACTAASADTAQRSPAQRTRRTAAHSCTGLDWTGWTVRQVEGTLRAGLIEAMSWWAGVHARFAHAGTQWETLTARLVPLLALPSPRPPLPSAPLPSPSPPLALHFPPLPSRPPRSPSRHLPSGELTRAHRTARPHAAAPGPAPGRLPAGPTERARTQSQRWRPRHTGRCSGRTCAGAAARTASRSSRPTSLRCAPGISESIRGASPRSLPLRACRRLSAGVA
jgi:hypothetical protein